MPDALLCKAKEVTTQRNVPTGELVEEEIMLDRGLDCLPGLRWRRPLG